MSATQVNLTERSKNVVFSKKKEKKVFTSNLLLISCLHLLYLVFSKKKGLHLESDSDFLHFPFKFVMTPQQGSSLLKSCERRSFSFTRGNLQAFATHPHSLGDPLLGRDPWFKKHCSRPIRRTLVFFSFQFLIGCLF